MSKIIILGIVLSVVIFIPRLLKKLPQGEPTPTKPVTTQPATGQPAATGKPAATGQPTKAVATRQPATTRTPVKATGKVNENIKRLQSQTKKLWELLQAEKKAREAADRKIMNMVRKMVVSRQIGKLSQKAEAKKFHVPEWNAPYCFKAKLKAGDQSKYVKIGTGLVSAENGSEESRLTFLIGEMLLYFLHKEKLAKVRLYRETAEHARLLSDAVPPDKIDPNGKKDLKIGSPHLDATLQCTYSLTDGGKLTVKAQLFNIPKGTLLYEAEKSNDNYEQVARSVAIAIAGLNHVQMKASSK